MGKINGSRMILGGIVAGIVINIGEFLLNGVVMKQQIEDMMRSLGKTTPMSGSAMAVWVVYGFAVGIVAVWLYAAIRPRYGPGAGTAFRAALAVWFLGWFLMMVGMSNMGIAAVSVLALVWTFVELVVATELGAWLYKEA